MAAREFGDAIVLVGDRPRVEAELQREQAEELPDEFTDDSADEPGVDGPPPEGDAPPKLSLIHILDVYKRQREARLVDARWPGTATVRRG